MAKIRALKPEFFTDVIPQARAGVDRNGDATLGERAAVKAAPGTVLVTPPEGLTIGSSPALTQEVPNG